MSLRKLLIAAASAVVIASFVIVGEAKPAQSPGRVYIESPNYLLLDVFNPSSGAVNVEVVLRDPIGLWDMTSSSVSIGQGAKLTFVFRCTGGSLCWAFPFITPAEVVVSGEYLSMTARYTVVLPAGSFRVL